VIWIILSEIFPNAVRGRAIGLATFAMWMANYLVTQTFTIMNENSWLLARFKHAFPFYVYAGFCLVLLAVMLMVPETRGKSLEQIETIWGRSRLKSTAA
jgi:MFS family permease